MSYIFNTSELRLTRARATSAPYTQDQGPFSVLGQEYTIGPVSVDKVLYWVDSSGDVVGDEKWGANPLKAATDVAVSILAGSGKQVWVYVNADSAIAKGEPVKRVIAASGELKVEKVAAGDSAELVVGVAQHNIAAGDDGWILKRGIGEVADSDGDVAAAGDLLKPDAATLDGEAETAGATDANFGIALETASGGFLTAILDCPGV